MGGLCHLYLNEAIVKTKYPNGRNTTSMRKRKQSSSSILDIKCKNVSPQIKRTPHVYAPQGGTGKELEVFKRAKLSPWCILQYNPCENTIIYTPPLPVQIFLGHIF